MHVEDDDFFKIDDNGFFRWYYFSSLVQDMTNLDTDNVGEDLGMSLNLPYKFPEEDESPERDDSESGNSGNSG